MRIQALPIPGDRFIIVLDEVNTSTDLNLESLQGMKDSTGAAAWLCFEERVEVVA